MRRERGRDGDIGYPVSQVVSLRPPISLGWLLAGPRIKSADVSGILPVSIALEITLRAPATKRVRLSPSNRLGLDWSLDAVTTLQTNKAGAELFFLCPGYKVSSPCLHMGVRGVFFSSYVIILITSSFTSFMSQSCIQILKRDLKTPSKVYITAIMVCLVAVLLSIYCLNYFFLGFTACLNTLVIVCIDFNNPLF